MAPALYSSFESRFGRKSLPTLEQAFDLSLELGGTIEQGVIREEGASFNPLPARVCHIANQSGGIQTVEDAATALLTPAHTLEKDLEVSSQLRGAFDRASRIRVFMQGTSLRLVPTDELITLSYALDIVRHLHMTSWPTTKRHDVWRNIESQSVMRLHSPHTEQLIRRIRDAAARLFRQSEA